MWWTVLSDTAIRAADLDEAAALEAMKRAEEAQNDQQSEMEYAQLKVELSKITAQLRSIERLRKIRQGK